MEIKFNGQYDRSLFFKAVRLANQPARNQRRFLAIMLVFSLIAIGIMLYRIFETGDWMGNLILIGATVLSVSIVAWVMLQPYFSARKMWANPGTRRPLKGVVTNQGITYQLEAGDNQILWGRFNRVRKTTDMVTLIRNDGLLVIFPRRFFKKDADWRKFEKLVESKFVKT